MNPQTETAVQSRQQGQLFTRQNHHSSFVAYSSKPTKKPVLLMVDGEEVRAPFHPDVFVNEYTSVKIASISVGDKSANISFAAKTVAGGNMKYDFGGNVQLDSDLLRLAQAAKEQDRPVYVAIETSRKYRDPKGNVIPFTTPIDVLRGCENGPQSSGNSNATRSHCSKVIAAIGFADEPTMTAVSEEARSNPYKWDAVRGNQDGDLVPAGYIIPGSPDGTRVGGITKAPEKTGGLDADVEKKLDCLMKMVSHLQRGNAGSAATARPWDEFRGDGTLNPGSYAVTQIRHTRETATRVIATALGERLHEMAGQDVRELESSLTRVLLWQADGAQTAVDGRVDRMAKTHVEAGAWVKHVIFMEDPYTAEMIDNKDLASDWAKRVRAAAGERYREAVELAAEFATPIGNQQQAQQQAQQPEAPADPEQTPPEQDEQAHAPVEAEPSPKQGDRRSSEAEEQAGAPTMFVDDQEARQRWDNLIQQVNMASHIDHLNPALVERFGTYMSTQIPAEAMRAALTEWEANPRGFINWAGSIYEAHNAA